MESTAEYTLMESTIEYTPKSILRFYTSSEQIEHYSAVVLTDLSVLQVKTPMGVTKERFESVEQWLTSLPGQPSSSQLVIDTNPSRSTQNSKRSSNKEKKDKKEEKEEKEQKVDHKSDWENRKSIDLSKRKSLYPLSYDKFNTFPWLRLIHQFVKEVKPSLLKEEPFIKAFNGLIEFMIRNNDNMITYIPLQKQFAYESPLVFDMSHSSALKGFPVSILSTFVVLDNHPYRATYKRFISNRELHSMVLTKDGNQLIRELYDIYQPVYELIKTDVIPYVEKKKKTTIMEIKIRESKRFLNHYNKKFDRRRDVYERGIERLTKQYDRDVIYLQNKIKEITDKMEQYKRDME
jgi:hypothetical protein